MNKITDESTFRVIDLENDVEELISECMTFADIRESNYELSCDLLETEVQVNQSVTLEDAYLKYTRLS